MLATYLGFIFNFLRRVGSNDFFSRRDSDFQDGTEDLIASSALLVVGLLHLESTSDEVDALLHLDSVSVDILMRLGPFLTAMLSESVVFLAENFLTSVGLFLVGRGAKDLEQQARLFAALARTCSTLLVVDFFSFFFEPTGLVEHLGMLIRFSLVDLLVVAESLDVISTFVLRFI